MTDPQAEIMGKFQAAQSKAMQLISDLNMKDVTDEIGKLTSSVSELGSELTKIRSRGYAFASYLEAKVQTCGERWSTLRGQLSTLINQEINQLRQEAQKLELLLEKTKNQADNPTAVGILLPSLESEVGSLEDKIKAAIERVQSRFTELRSEVTSAGGQIREINSYLDEQDEASFPFLAGEKLFLASDAEWVATGKGDKDPDGVLFLTDQRLIFEQKEKTGKKLGLFGGKHTQELEWAIPLAQIQTVEPENKGIFGSKDLVHITLASDAPYPSITIEVKNVKSKAWVEQAQRMLNGEANGERIS